MNESTVLLLSSSCSGDLWNNDGWIDSTQTDQERAGKNKWENYGTKLLPRKSVDQDQSFNITQLKEALLQSMKTLPITCDIEFTFNFNKAENFDESGTVHLTKKSEINLFHERKMIIGKRELNPCSRVNSFIFPQDTRVRNNDAYVLNLTSCTAMLSFNKHFQSSQGSDDSHSERTMVLPIIPIPSIISFHSAAKRTSNIKVDKDRNRYEGSDIFLGKTSVVKKNVIFDFATAFEQLVGKEIGTSNNDGSLHEVNDIDEVTPEKTQRDILHPSESLNTDLSDPSSSIDKNSLLIIPKQESFQEKKLSQIPPTSLSNDAKLTGQRHTLCHHTIQNNMISDSSNLDILLNHKLDLIKASMEIDAKRFDMILAVLGVSGLLAIFVYLYTSYQIMKRESETIKNKNTGDNDVKRLKIQSPFLKNLRKRTWVYSQIMRFKGEFTAKYALICNILIRSILSIIAWLTKTVFEMKAIIGILIHKFLWRCVRGLHLFEKRYCQMNRVNLSKAQRLVLLPEYRTRHLSGEIMNVSLLGSNYEQNSEKQFNLYEGFDSVIIKSSNEMNSLESRDPLTFRDDITFSLSGRGRRNGLSKSIKNSSFEVSHSKYTQISHNETENISDTSQDSNVVGSRLDIVPSHILVDNSNETPQDFKGTLNSILSSLSPISKVFENAGLQNTLHSPESIALTSVSSPFIPDQDPWDNPYSSLISSNDTGEYLNMQNEEMRVTSDLISLSLQPPPFEEMIDTNDIFSSKMEYTNLESSLYSYDEGQNTKIKRAKQTSLSSTTDIANIIKTEISFTDLHRSKIYTESVVDEEVNCHEKSDLSKKDTLTNTSRINIPHSNIPSSTTSSENQSDSEIMIYSNDESLMMLADHKGLLDTGGQEKVLDERYSERKSEQKISVDKVISSNNVESTLLEERNDEIDLPCSVLRKQWLEKVACRKKNNTVVLSAEQKKRSFLKPFDISPDESSMDSVSERKKSPSEPIQWTYIDQNKFTKECTTDQIVVFNVGLDVGNKSEDAVAMTVTPLDPIKPKELDQGKEMLIGSQSESDVLSQFIQQADSTKKDEQETIKQNMVKSRRPRFFEINKVKSADEHKNPYSPIGNLTSTNDSNKDQPEHTLDVIEQNDMSKPQKIEKTLGVSAPSRPLSLSQMRDLSLKPPDEIVNKLETNQDISDQSVMNITAPNTISCTKPRKIPKQNQLLKENPNYPLQNHTQSNSESLIVTEKELYRETMINPTVRPVVACHSHETESENKLFLESITSKKGGPRLFSNVRDETHTNEKRSNSYIPSQSNTFQSNILHEGFGELKKHSYDNIGIDPTQQDMHNVIAVPQVKSNILPKELRKSAHDASKIVTKAETYMNKLDRKTSKSFDLCRSDVTNSKKMSKKNENVMNPRSQFVKDKNFNHNEIKEASETSLTSGSKDYKFSDPKEPKTNPKSSVDHSGSKVRQAAHEIDGGQPSKSKPLQAEIINQTNLSKKGEPSNLNNKAFYFGTKIAKNQVVFKEKSFSEITKPISAVSEMAAKFEKRKINQNNLSLGTKGQNTLPKKALSKISRNEKLKFDTEFLQASSKYSERNHYGSNKAIEVKRKPTLQEQISEAATVRLSRIRQFEK